MRVVVIIVRTVIIIMVIAMVSAIIATLIRIALENDRDIKDTRSNSNTK